MLTADCRLGIEQMHQLSVRGSSSKVTLVLMLGCFLIGNLPPEKVCLVGMQSRPVIGREREPQVFGMDFWRCEWLPKLALPL